MANNSFCAQLLRSEGNRNFIVSASRVRSIKTIPGPLKAGIRSPELEKWFQAEAGRRISALKNGLSHKEIQEELEMGNRYPDGSMDPISLSELLQMRQFNLSAGDILDRAKQGAEILRNNPINAELGAAARGIPGGGASSRAAKWARQNPEIAANFGIDENLPRFLYRAGGRTLAQLTLDFSQHIARSFGKIFPNIVMTNSEIVAAMMRVVRNEWGNWKPGELENTVFFNQIILPRMRVKDRQMIEEQLYPAGHGDYPYLMARHHIAKTLAAAGIKYFIFSNADEWQWQADPVMISIAQELFNRGHHMLIVGVENINNQFGGGFVRMTDGRQSLVETPRLPWETIKQGKAPVALNTTFYICDVEYLADHEEELQNVEKSLVVKEAPGREQNIEQIFGVDSWAGDVFAAILNPAFIQWPRLNFLGIKDGGFVAGAKPEPLLGGRTYLHYVNETVAVYPALMSRLIGGDRSVATFLHRTGYSYLEPKIG